VVVQHYDKSEIRDLIRVARRRGVRLLDPTPEELDSPYFIQKMRSLFAAYPEDRLYERAKRIADHLGLRLTDAQRMNKRACDQFIRDNREKAVQPPSEKQIALGKMLAEVQGIPFPSECEDSYPAWKAFMRENLTREDMDLIHEVSARLSLGGIKLNNYAHRVWALARAKKFLAREEREIVRRIDEMLCAQEEPDLWDISDALNVPIGKVSERAKVLGNRNVFEAVSGTDFDELTPWFRVLADSEFLDETEAL
jgi:hypothetical protein